MLQQFFRSHFWIVVMAFLLSSSYLVAQMTSEAARLLLPPSSPYRLPRNVKKNQDVDSEPLLQAKFAILNKNNLFDPTNKPITPPKAPKRVEPTKSKVKRAACDPKAVYKPSNLPLQLKGTSISSDPLVSVAAVYDARRRKHVALRVGDDYMGIKICAIEKEEKPIKDPIDAKATKYAFFLKLDRGQGRFEFLESGRKAGSGRGTHITSMYKSYRKLRNTKINLKGIRKLKGDKFRVNRNLINTLTNRLDWVGAQAAIVPYFKRGRAVGFKINHIRKNSLYGKLGLKNGDVIKRINGYEFTSPQKALEAYSNLTSAGNLSVDILRSGKSKNMNYEIKE